MEWVDWGLTALLLSFSVNSLHKITFSILNGNLVVLAERASMFRLSATAR
jgi:hypothetical protein